MAFMDKRMKLLIAAFAVPVLILFGICYRPFLTLLNGDEIVLQTKPIDPTDLFRGDYVILRYEAEEIPEKLVEQEVFDAQRKWRSETEVYVLLEEKNGVHVPVNVTLRKPDRGLYIKGELNYIGTNREDNEVAFIRYSLDRYYVEDNTGTEWEKASRQGDILAKVKISNGYAILTGIEME